MTDRQLFPHSPTSVAAARHFVLDVVADAPIEVFQRVEVMVSEVATNAVVHAQTEFEVAVHHDGARIRVEITDRGSGEPAVQHPALRDRHGRGLRIVEALADDWGVRHDVDGSSKTVWFAVAVTPSDPGT